MEDLPARNYLISFYRTRFLFILFLYTKSTIIQSVLISYFIIQSVLTRTSSFNRSSSRISSSACRIMKLKIIQILKFRQSVYQNPPSTAFQNQEMTTTFDDIMDADVNNEFQNSFCHTFSKQIS